MTPLAPIHPRASAEAVAWFRARVPTTSEEWKLLIERAQRGAFRLANVAVLDLVTTVWRALDVAIATGTDFREFKREVSSALAREWGAPNAPRVATIFRTNTQVAYAAGRYATAVRPDTLAVRPWWRYDAILDGRTTPICRPRDGLVKRASDPWWSSNYPPGHYQCRSGITTLSESQAARGGGATPHPQQEPPRMQETFGATPSPDAWHPNQNDYPPALWAHWSDLVHRT